ncbi:hypothetical protein FNV43_RR18964 [Rhamnella rubrinervis]|uniref:Uncharacterized protein n=1 Tax=Rhamnella rubrinervis TaxID=2594499 RepID=A0A8K0GY59_9ROSA|nr:hypothetical protein FNV43_RR18964 [Rhamnella rubrinervis]
MDRTWLMPPPDGGEGMLCGAPPVVVGNTSGDGEPPSHASGEAVGHGGGEEKKWYKLGGAPTSLF